MKPAQTWLRQSLESYRWHKLLPTTRWGDRWYAQLFCLEQNGHWPRAQQGNLNDFLAFLKMGPEIEAPLRRRVSDKAQAKPYIDRVLGPGWSIPTLGLIEHPRDLPSFAFPERCVIKPTHASGEIIFRQQGQPVPLQRIQAWFHLNHYRRGRERNYRGLAPRILIEPWLDCPDHHEYWVFCLRGQPIELIVHRNRIHSSVGYSQVLGVFDSQGRPSGPDQFDEIVPPPANLSQIMEAAAQLSQGLLFARIDFLHTTSGTYVCEITSSTANGAVEFGSTAREDFITQLYFGPQGFCLGDFPELV